MASPLDLCSAADLAADLNVDESDPALARVITAAGQIIASYCGRRFDQAEVTEAPACYGRRTLILERRPVVSVSSVEVDGVELAPTDYAAGAANGLLVKASGTWPFFGEASASVTPTYTAHPEGGPVVVTYVGGYVTPGMNAANGALVVDLPADVQEAALMTATALYRARGRDALISSESLGDWSATYRGTGAPAGAVPDLARALLAPYTEWRAS